LIDRIKFGEMIRWHLIYFHLILKIILFY